MIKRLLIANRGEIACRIIRAAKAMGVETVAVYSDADAQAQHVKLADRAVPIGLAPAKDSYLNVGAIIMAAKEAEADAIHPGYGFLSENADFAKAVTDAGITFVGPSADVIAQMGDKRTARGIAEKAGVPVVPGYDGNDADTAVLEKEAKRIGTPLMIKATAGGGGRGLRRVDDLKGFTEALESARREAGSAFGDSGIILERMITDARHVEVQILGDTQGNVVHLFERDCSSQRRHQKVLEEAPCATITDKTRAGITDAAVGLAKAVSYTGAGTVEFLVDADGAFYFLEMNTRLQVEHPVTELVTGVDLVAEQLRVASGEAISVAQDDITLTGHAIEARLYAEDPAQSFMPQTGTLGVFDIPAGDGCRLDSGVVAGDMVSPYYDPMLAKLIAHGKTREEARARLASMLDESRIAGMATNKAWLAYLLKDEPFRLATMRTQTLDHATPFIPLSAENQALALALVLQAGAIKNAPMPALAGWRTHTGGYTRRVFEVDGTRVPVEVSETPTPTGWDITATVGHKSRTTHFDGESFLYQGEKLRVSHTQMGDEHAADLGRWHFKARDVTHAPAEKSTAGGTGRLTAPMDGQIVAVPVEKGALVKAGDLICVIEAMKMEHHIRADMDGTIEDLSASIGAQVKSRAPLATITSGETA
ncbi:MULTISPECIES: acetyl/propionyl/methylcrotonyl-CoA carboxylase subunit alpha [Kordiimonas]|jgi:geranyl-CoA carboxylase alpha subunit|uniref:acetyl/propionyl/methylcrotonyl-CoA carboxylase subunit alpha n=1 Tax=Kordiimonas TaxID=288021 RepID=UPI00257E302D|nr:acetyl-CoA carboxylase biotin carboxylase subunit [Kordiimonas sp. UBA4487]